MPSYGWLPCHHCIQGFDLLNWPIPNLQQRAKVFIVCPGCKNTLEFFAFEIDIICNGEPSKLRAEIFKIGQVEPMPKDYHRDLLLRTQISRKQNLEGVDLA
jgi:hypothetical protein